MRVHSPRKRPGASIPPIEADAPNVVWPIDFQFGFRRRRQGDQDRLDDDEHTRDSLLHVVESRSPPNISSSPSSKRCSPRAGGHRRCCGWDNGLESVSQALQRCCDAKVGLSYIPPRGVFFTG